MALPSSRGLFLSVALAPLVAACGEAPSAREADGKATSAVIYGTDGRRELWETSDETLRSLASRVTVAIVDDADLRRSSGGTVGLPEESLREILGVCPDERFAEQPAAVQCSGVLVSPRLVLTAMHCLRDVPCDDMAVVRGFAYDAPGELRELKSTDVARCARVLDSKPTRKAGGERDLDYAWLELEEELAGASVPIAERDSIVPGAPLALIGHGEGVPVKIDDDGTVLEVDVPFEGQLRASIDNFAGGSGAAVFDASGALIGVAVNGAPDYDLTDAGCLTHRTLAEGDGVEVVTLAARARAGLCNAAPTSYGCPPDSPESSCSSSASRTVAAPGAGAAIASLVLGLSIIRRSARRR